MRLVGHTQDVNLGKGVLLAPVTAGFRMETGLGSLEGDREGCVGLETLTVVEVELTGGLALLTESREQSPGGVAGIAGGQSRLLHGQDRVTADKDGDVT